MKSQFMRRELSAFAVGALLLSAPPLVMAQAQSVAQAAPVAQAAAVPMVISASSGTVLPQGTTVRLRTLMPLSSQDAKVGQPVDLEVAEDVMLNGRVVIPRGSPASGDVTLVKKKGMWGKSGKLEARVLSVRANGANVSVRGTIGDKGDTGTAGVIGAVVVLPIAGFFVTGTSASLPAGTGATATLEADLPVQFGESAAPVASAINAPTVATGTPN